MFTRPSLCFLIATTFASASGFTFLFNQGDVELKSLIGSEQVRLAAKVSFPILSNFTLLRDYIANITIDPSQRSGENKKKLSDIILAWLEIQHKYNLLLTWQKEIKMFQGPEDNYENHTCQIIQSNIANQNIQFLIKQLKSSKRELIDKRGESDWQTTSKTFLSSLSKHLSLEQKTTLQYLKLLTGLKYKLPSLTILELQQLDCLPENFHITRTRCRRTPTMFDCLLNLQLYSYIPAKEFLTIPHFSLTLGKTKNIYVTNDSLFTANCPNLILCPPEKNHVTQLDCIHSLLENEHSDISDCEFFSNHQPFIILQTGLLISKPGTLTYNDTNYDINQTSLVTSDLPFNLTLSAKTYIFPENGFTFTITTSDLTDTQTAQMHYPNLV